MHTSSTCMHAVWGHPKLLMMLLTWEDTSSPTPLCPIKVPIYYTPRPLGDHLLCVSIYVSVCIGIEAVYLHIHIGTFQEAGVVQESYNLNHPLRIISSKLSGMLQAIMWGMHRGWRRRYTHHHFQSGLIKHLRSAWSLFAYLVHWPYLLMVLSVLYSSMLVKKHIWRSLMVILQRINFMQYLHTGWLFWSELLTWLFSNYQFSWCKQPLLVSSDMILDNGEILS